MSLLEALLRRIFIAHFEGMTVSQVRAHAKAQGITPGQLMRQIDAFASSASSSTRDGFRSKTLQSARR